MMSDLIPAPVLDIRDEEQLAAEAIARTSGGLTADLVAAQIEERRRLLALIQSGAIVADLAICPELTNANPSAPHTVLLEAMGWLLGQMGYRINQIPKQNQIAFANLFKIGLRQASPATTVLEFSVAPPNGVDVFVPLGTQISTDDGKIVFATTEELVIPFGQATGSAAARNTVSGATLLSPDTLTKMVDPVAWVDSVSNPEAIDGGSNDETIEEALERARNYQQRAERLVTTRDLERAILEDVLRSQGIVRGFPFVAAGEFNAAAKRPGHTTLVVMTRSGLPISAEAKRVINGVLETIEGNQFIYVSDPIYVNFSVTASVKLIANAPETATLKAIETNLRNFYAPAREQFGRDILRQEIIGVIEDTRGVDHIVSDPSGPILQSPLASTPLEPWQLPKIVNVNMNAV